MNAMNDNHDIKFRKLFQKTGLDSPSPEFTPELMKKIEQLEQSSAFSSDKNALNSWYWGIFIAILTSIGLSIMYYYNISLLPDSFKSILSPVFESIYHSFKSIFETIRISSTTLVIIVGFVSIVGIERILNKLKVTKKIFFSF